MAAKRDELIAAAVQCHRAARASISPEKMLAELRDAVAALDANQPPMISQAPRSRPILRVIQGGLSR
jgi:hypothetical protein